MLCENMLFAGLWYSSKKPEASLFLEPLYRELKILEKGIEVQIYTNNGFINTICRCLLLARTFDVPARSLVTETVQFNGKYGCIKCYQEGKCCKTKKGGNVWVCPYAVEDPKVHKGPTRVSETTQCCELLVSTWLLKRIPTNPSIHQTFYGP